MTRERGSWLVVLGLLVALLTWIARHTYWDNIKAPLPPKGEAATNPFYVVQRFSEALGARTQRYRGLTLPSTRGVIFISAWHWDLSVDRRRRVEQWVESGGRLVVDESLVSGTDAFEQWSGIGRRERSLPIQPGRLLPFQETRCYTLDEEGGGPPDFYSICGMDAGSSLTSSRKTDWALQRAQWGIQAIRVRVGGGSVTVLNGWPFVGRGLFDDDNAQLFVAATQLHRGDEIYFFSERDHASLPELAWRLGWPVICLLILLLTLAVWRSGVRFGPPVAPTETARRSLAEQIRGTGQFMMRVGSAGALHAATARSLDEVASRYITAYQHLPGAEKMAALASATGFEADALAAALNYSSSRRTEHLRAAIELLETARRRILLENTRSRHTGSQDGN